MAVDDPVLVALQSARTERDALRGQLDALERSEAEQLAALRKERETLEHRIEIQRATEHASVLRVKALRAHQFAAMTARMKARVWARSVLRGVLMLFNVLGVLMLPEALPGGVVVLAFLVNIVVLWWMSNHVDRAELADE